MTLVPAEVHAAGVTSGTAVRMASNARKVVVAASPFSPEGPVVSKATVKTRSGSTTCGGGLRSARSISPAIARLIPTASAVVRMMAIGTAGAALRLRTAVRRSTTERSGMSPAVASSTTGRGAAVATAVLEEEFCLPLAVSEKADCDRTVIRDAQNLEEHRGLRTHRVSIPG